eukprot:COSAG02_NODE_31064_length_540_cov_0.598639_1_plen_66_part_01
MGAQAHRALLPRGALREGVCGFPYMHSRVREPMRGERAEWAKMAYEKAGIGITITTAQQAPHHSGD